MPARGPASAGLRCHCDHCLNNTCTIHEHGFCSAQMTLNTNNEIERKYNCFNQDNPLVSSIVCDDSVNQTTPSIIKCCSSADFCNQREDFLPSEEYARSQLERAIVNYPQQIRTVSPANNMSSSSLLSSAQRASSSSHHKGIVSQYSNIPVEMKLAFVVLAGLLLISAIALAQSVWYRRRRGHGVGGGGGSGSGSSSSSNGSRRPKEHHVYGDYTENSSAKVHPEIAVYDTNSMASREPLISNCNVSQSATPVNMICNSNSLNANHPHAMRHGPWTNEDSITGAKAQSSFQTTLGSGDYPDQRDTSTGSGAGQPYLTRRSIAHDIELIEVVGRGYFGVVWRGQYKGQPVAVKIFSAMAEPSWEREAEIYQTTLLRHKNILGFIATDRRDNANTTGYWLVTDYYPMGSLCDFLHENSLSMIDAMRMAYSITDGLSHLHMEILGTQGKPAIAHRDLKSKNILVKNDGTCCIADLGMAVRYSSNTNIVDVPANTRVGTRRYLAPEVLDDKLNLMDFEGVKATDVYALALVFWEILRRTCYTSHLSDHNQSSSSESSNHQRRQRAGSLGKLSDSNETASSSFIDNQQRDEQALVCDPYESPYQEFVSADPTMEEMRVLVCEQKIRPSQSARWARYAPMRDYVTLMRECWYEKPQARLSALRVKKTLGDLAKRYYDLNMEYD